MKDIISLIDFNEKDFLELIEHASKIKKNPENYKEPIRLPEQHYSFLQIVTFGSIAGLA